MNFFEQQEDALRRSKLLLLLFALAVVGITALTTVCVYYFSPLLFDMPVGVSISITAIGVPAIIIIASLYKINKLAAGGRVVAEMMGARALSQAKNLREQQLINIVEEMAIASGMPLPKIYVLDGERGINAFTAGYTLKDAIICVTEGCLNLLNRDELQGVVAHEFSHILYGDTRLNTRMIGILFGISMIGLIGKKMLFFGEVDKEEENHRMIVGDDGKVYFLPTHYQRDEPSDTRGSGIGGFIVLGVALIILGAIGLFLTSLIQAAVNRQREYLADASAVRFTRNPQGIGGALKKIGGWADGSTIRHEQQGMIAHMLLHFGKEQTFELASHATHPPLNKRIKRIEPRWNGAFPEVKVPYYASEAAYQAEKKEKYNAAKTAAILGAAHIISNHQVEIRHFEKEKNIDYARRLMNSMPLEWKEMAHGEFAACVVCALLIRVNSSEEKTAQSIKLIEQFRYPWVAQVQILLKEHHLIDDMQRLPLLEIALPNISESVGQIDVGTFKVLLKSLIQIDKKVSLFEWCTYTIASEYLKQLYFSDNLIPFEQYVDRQALMPECQKLFSIVARYSNNGKMVEDAFQAACKNMSLSGEYAQLDTAAQASELSKILAKIRKIKPLQKPQLIRSLLHIIQIDKQVNATEQELLRTICLVIDNPMPPIVQMHHI